MNISRVPAVALLAAVFVTSWSCSGKGLEPEASPQPSASATPTPDYGAVPDSRLSPLVEAIASGDLRRVQSLVAEGARVNDQTPAGVTALTTAAGLGRVDIARFLIEKGADVNVKSPSGFTALMSAALNGQTTMVKLLIDSGADVKQADSSGRTALTYAGQNKHNQEIVELLQKAGAPN